MAAERAPRAANFILFLVVSRFVFKATSVVVPRVLLQSAGRRSDGAEFMFVALVMPL